METNKNEQFTMVPHILMRNKELKDGDKMTLAIIYSFHNNDKHCYISNNMLGDMLGISRTAASERVTKLESLGYIRCDRVMVNGKERRTMVPLRMVSLVGEPNVLVGKPTRISRSTDPSLVGEVGSIIQPLLLNKELHKIEYNILDKEIENINIQEQLDRINKLILEDNFTSADERGEAYSKKYNLTKQLQE